MKKNYIYLMLAVLAFCTVGCTDEFETQTTVKTTGEEILFGGTASYELNEKHGAKANATRTVYTGEQYEENGKTYEGINWVKNDQVRIYCPQAANAKYADYTVTANTTSGNMDSDKKGAYRYTYLSKSSENDEALQWGNVTKTHSFYSVYPSPDQYNASGKVDEADVIKSSNVLNGYIPGVQLPRTDIKTTTTNGHNHYIAEPNMQYAYMVARTDVKPNEISDNVFLQYIPIATAVEITLANHTDQTHAGKEEDPTKLPYEFKLTNITIGSADGSPVYGQFKADLSTMTDTNNDGYADTTPTVVPVEGTLGTQISIPMYSHGTDGTPTVLGLNEEVSVTVFMLPTVDLNSLKVTITGVEGIRTATISGGDFKVQAKKKTYIRNLPLTADILPFNLNNWLQFVENDVYVREISIPGTGGSATYALAQSDIDNQHLSVKRQYVVEQELNLAQQWEQGVRCFEFSVDKSTTSDDLGDAYIICSGVQTTKTLSSAIDEVVDLLANNPKEFAMAIITYETTGGWSGERNPSTFISQLKTFWTGVSSDVRTKQTLPMTQAGITLATALYDPSQATVGASRGKLFCIARPTSAHLDYGTDVIDVSAYEGSKMVAGSVTDANKNAGKRQAFLPSSSIKEDWTELNLPACHDDIMIIQGWGTLKDKWQQRGYTNFSRRGTNSTYTFNFSYSGYTYGAETKAEPGRPFDGSFFHKSNHQGWGSATPEITVDEDETTKNYTITIKGAAGNNYTSFTISGVTCNGYTFTKSDNNYVADFGNSKPTSDLEITVKYTCNYYRNNQTQNTDSNTEYSITIKPSDLEWETNTCTVTATASRSGGWGNYTYSYSYNYELTGSNSSSSSGSGVGTHYGTLPSNSASNYAITPSSLTADFSYDVVSGSNIMRGGAWVQEWARVSSVGQDYWDNEAADCRDGVSGCTGYYVSYWAPSYDEKLARAKETLTYARDKKYGSITYINSLCGYYITKSYPSSSAPCSLTDCGYGSTNGGQTYDEVWVLSASSPIAGMGGDIATYAEQINTDFYNHLLNLTSGSNYKPGSMGVILLDRVGDDGSKGAAIAGVVVSNNFLFEMETDPDYNKENELGLYDETNEGATMAPARRTIATKEGVELNWE